MLLDYEDQIIIIKKDFSGTSNNEVITDSIFGCPITSEDFYQHNNLYSELELSRILNDYSDLDPQTEYISCPDDLAKSIANIIKIGSNNEREIAMFALNSFSLSIKYEKLNDKEKDIFFKMFSSSFKGKNSVIGDLLFYRLVETSDIFSEVLHDFTLFIIFNEIIAEYMKTGELISLKDYTVENHDKLINHTFEVFNNLDFTYHAYTLKLAKSMITYGDILTRISVQENKLLTIYSAIDNRRLTLPAGMNALDMITLSENVSDSENIPQLRTIPHIGTELSNLIDTHLASFFNENIYLDATNLPSVYTNYHNSLIMLIRDKMYLMDYNDYALNTIHNFFHAVNDYIDSYIEQNSYVNKMLSVSKVLKAFYLTMKINELSGKEVEEKFIKNIIDYRFNMSITDHDSIDLMVNLDDLDSYAEHIVNNDFTVPYNLLMNTLETF